MRLIDADALKKDVLDLPNCYNGFSDTYDKACIIGLIDEQPTIEERKWIPCSERLPEARRSVLISTNHKCGNWTGEGCYWETTESHVIWKGYRWNATYWDDEVIAWMPLPEPYKGET